MNKRITALLTVCLVVMATTAQSISKQINDIKRSSQYLSAEETSETEAQAYELAEELLAKQISEYASSQKQLKNAANVIVKDVAGKAEKLLMNRGTMVRVFLYVKKADIIAADNTRVLVQPQKTSQDEADTTSKKESKKQSKSKAVQQTDKPLVTTVERIGGTSGQSTDSKLAAWQQAVVDELLNCATVTEARALMTRLRAERKLKRFGPADSCPDASNSLWLIFDEHDAVVTILGEGQTERTNFRSQTKDALSNYSGKGAIWFTLAK